MLLMRRATRLQRRHRAFLGTLALAAGLNSTEGATITIAPGSVIITATFVAERRYVTGDLGSRSRQAQQHTAKPLRGRLSSTQQPL